MLWLSARNIGKLQSYKAIFRSSISKRYFSLYSRLSVATSLFHCPRYSHTIIGKQRSKHIPKIFTMPLVTITSNIVEGLKRHGVVPDVVDEFSPRGLITVSYGGKTEVTLGNTLLAKETQSRPVVYLTFNEDQDKSNDSYTLVMTDPDAPSRGDNKWSEYAHYVVSGIKPKPVSADTSGMSTAIDFDSANELLPYLGPAPPPGTGKHRYVLILYKEGTMSPKSVEGRPNWGTGISGYGARDFAKKHGLTPIAINFFFAQNPSQATRPAE